MTARQAAPRLAAGYALLAGLSGYGARVVDDSTRSHLYTATALIFAAGAWLWFCAWRTKP